MSSIAELAAMLHPLERTVVPLLRNGITATALEQQSGMDGTEVLRALMWLEGKGVIQISTTAQKQMLLDANGARYAQLGLPEHRLLAALVQRSGNIQEIGKAAGLDAQEVGVSIGLLKSREAITLTVHSATPTTVGKTLAILEWPEESLLRRLAKGEQPAEGERVLVEALRKRRQILREEVRKTKTVQLTDLGRALQAQGIPQGEVLDQLTPEMLRSGEWRGKAYRRYDVESRVPHLSGGKRHFVNQAVQYIRQIWLELGFQEMTGNLTHTAFWDLDALFVPQDHPARQMQDTFYLKDAKQGDKILRGKIPAALAKKIKAIHEHGGDTGSTGWGGIWNPDEAAKVLLRTHTTVLSAQTLAKLKSSDLPAKFFAVSPVFRNEALDWKHLFEFHQVDGIVIDPDANFSHLKGYLRTFYQKMGYPNVRLRPAHFPYTEPSVEIEAFHPVKKQWVELGGAGIFRPEMVKPLLGMDIPVLAWGLGMGRIIAGQYGIVDIRDLNRNDLKQLREMPWWGK